MTLHTYTTYVMGILGQGGHGCTSKRMHRTSDNLKQIIGASIISFSLFLISLYKNDSILYYLSISVSENKVLCHPSSVDSLTTSAGTEDHVSMGGFSARKCVTVVEHVEQGEKISTIQFESYWVV